MAKSRESTLVCDFCVNRTTAAPITWTHTAIGVEGDDGLWGACEECHHDIKFERWGDMLQRSAQHAIINGKVPNMELALLLVGRAHKLFRDHATGSWWPAHAAMDGMTQRRA